MHNRQLSRGEELFSFSPLRYDMWTIILSLVLFLSALGHELCLDMSGPKSVEKGISSSTDNFPLFNSLLAREL